MSLLFHRTEKLVKFCKHAVRKKKTEKSICYLIENINHVMVMRNNHFERLQVKPYN